MADFCGFSQTGTPRAHMGTLAGWSGQTNQGWEFDMQIFASSLGSKFVAAVFSLAFSALMFATAIAPANHGSVLPGVLA
jgi:hypothetical protein